jgi:hypothetical protein
MPKTGLSPAKSANSKIALGADGRVLVNHLRSLGKLPWSRATKAGLDQAVSLFQGPTTRGPKGTKRVPKRPAPVKPE